MSLTIYGGPDDGRYSTRIVGIANNRTMTPSADGSYELWLSPDPQPGKNWLKFEPDSVAGLTRDYLRNPGKDQRAVWTIEAIDPPKVKQDDIKTLVKRFRAAEDFTRDESGTIKRIYQLARHPYEGGAQNKMAEYSAANPRGRHGAVTYDLAALGLNAGAIRERLRPYSERFGLGSEGRPAHR